eukprot:5196601-Prorocentrum_lima.AAC.1
MTVLEGTIPNAKEVEARLMEIDGSLMEISNNAKGLERGLSYVVEQVDQLEQNLSIHPFSLNKELLLDFNIV